MACSISCIISAVFVIGMIYFYNMTDKSEIVKHYKSNLPTDLQKRYEKITEEDKKIFLMPYHRVTGDKKIPKPSRNNAGEDFQLELPFFRKKTMVQNQMAIHINQ
jgi:hypothetical protein